MMMSKSLGSGYPLHPNFVRQSTDVTKISYAGCLYKRSNHPVVSPTSVTTTADSSSSFPQGNYNRHAQQRRNLFQPASSHSYLSGHPDTNATDHTTGMTTYTMEQQAQPQFTLGTSPSFGLTTVEDATTTASMEKEEAPKHENENDHDDKEKSMTTTLAWQFVSHLLDLPKDLFVAKPQQQQHQAEKTEDDKKEGAFFPQQQQVNSGSRLSSSPISIPVTLSKSSILGNNSSRNINNLPLPSATTASTTSNAPPVIRRIHSQSEEGSAEDWQAAEDIIAADGHVWRARYCVLDDGILYFYRCRADADSAVAVAQRENDQHEVIMSTTSSFPSPSMQQHNNNTVNQAATGDNDRPSLSSSFRPSSMMQQLTQSPRQTTPSAATSKEGVVVPHIWEKRVPVSCVGAVRSAEAEFGPHALQLCPLEDVGDEDDVLILKARNATEMGEWLFQLHRSIELWVKNIMTTSLIRQQQQQQASIVGEMIVPAGNLHHLISSSMTPSVLLSPRVRPHYHHHYETAVLSHGHGRSSLHRRRVELDEENQDENDLKAIPFMPDADSTVPPLPLRPAAPISPCTPSAPVPEVFELEDVDILSAPEQTAEPPPELQHPAPPKKGKYVPPHLRNSNAAPVPPPAAVAAALPRTKYVPPHLRNKEAVTATPPPLETDSKSQPSLSLAERLANDETASNIAAKASPEAEVVIPIVIQSPPTPKSPLARPLKLGGCADPDHVIGSILDTRFIPRKASKLYRTAARPYGFSAAKWEIGAISECGIRDANEDAYLIVGDLWQAFDKAGEEDSTKTTSLDGYKLEQTPGLFCVFDGHCGDHAARYAAERFTDYLYQESTNSSCQTPDGQQEERPLHVESLIRRALSNLDDDFCGLCTQDGRLWESGATALIAALVDDDLVIANLGDARGVLSRSVQDVSLWEEVGWTVLQEEYEFVEEGETSSNDDAPPSTTSIDRPRCVFKDVTPRHNPARPDERKRIEEANGWITTEAEIPVSQAHRLDLQDELARDILNRCLSRNGDSASAPHRLIEISRVCGELAVSRALGDRDFKAISDPKRVTGSPGTMDSSWQGPFFIPYPDDHSQKFRSDLVSNIPEVESLRIGQEGVTDEFLLLACDGLWDVMDADEAVRVTRRLLLDEDFSVKAAAERLARLAVHLGSSDNVTVLIIRFADREP